jgi:protein-tyrosine phosphatase
MAELVFREHLREAGLADVVEVNSAGTGPWHVGEPADERARKTLARHGYPTDHVASQVDNRHLGADLLVALDSGHARTLRRIADDPDRVRLLRSFAPDAGEDLDVPDPYYGEPAGFDEVLAMIEAASPGLLTWIRDNL